LKANCMNIKFGSLQNKVIMQLARYGPQTITEIQEGLKIDPNNYGAVSSAVHSLEKQQAIKKAGEPREYKGKIYPRFYLDGLGLAAAIKQGANLRVLRKQVLDLATDNPSYIGAPYEIPQEEMMQYVKAMFDGLRVLKPENRDIVIDCSSHGLPIMAQKITLPFFGLDRDNNKKIIKAMAKYPAVKVKISAMIKDVQDALNEEDV